MKCYSLVSYISTSHVPQVHVIQSYCDEWGWGVYVCVWWRWCCLYNNNKKKEKRKKCYHSYTHYKTFGV